MNTLPRISGREVGEVLLKVDYEKDKQKGNHIVLRQVVYPRGRVVVPDHHEVAKGTLRKITKHK